MTSTQNPTPSDLWYDAVTYARAYDWVDQPADKKAAIRELAVVRALLAIKAAGLHVEVWYSATPDAASKVSYRETGTILTIASSVNFTDQGVADRSEMSFVIADGVSNAVVIPVSAIHDLQTPPR